MIIPFANPIRFYQPNGTNQKDYNSVNESSIYWDSLPNHYPNRYLDKLEAVVYQDALGGEFGFENLDNWVDPVLNSEIVCCEVCIDGADAATYLLNDVSGKLAIRFKGTSTITVNNTTTATTIYTETLTYIEYGVKILDLPSSGDYEVIFEDSDICIQGIMACEPTLTYELCGIEVEANLMDVYAFGGVYLITTSAAFPFLSIDSPDYTDNLNVHEFDFSTFVGVNNATITVNFTGAASIARNATSVSPLTVSQLVNRINSMFGWVSSEFDGADKLTLKIPHYPITSIEYNDGVNPIQSFAPITTTEIDSLNWYLNNAGSATISNNSEFCLQIQRRLTGVPYNQSQDFTLLIGGEETDLIETDATSLVWTSTNDPAYLQLSKFALSYINGSCCNIKVGECISEPFEIVDVNHKNELKLTNLSYSDSCQSGNMAFSQYWNASLLVEGNLTLSKGNEYDTFEGQTSNNNLDTFAKRIREFKTVALPHNVAELLCLVFGFDKVLIDGVEFDIFGNPNAAEIDDKTDLFDFSIEVRQNDYLFIK